VRACVHVCALHVTHYAIMTHDTNGIQPRLCPSHPSSYLTPSQPFLLYAPWLCALPLFGALLGKLQVTAAPPPCPNPSHTSAADFEAHDGCCKAGVAACFAVCRHMHLLLAGVCAGGGERWQGSGQRAERADVAVLLTSVCVKVVLTSKVVARPCCCFAGERQAQCESECVT